MPEGQEVDEEMAQVRKCPNCGREFTPNWPTRKCCTDECSAEWKRKRRKTARLDLRS